jgi:hypothetical protein
VETWQKAGIPLPAVLKGIDRAFESFARSRRAAGGRQLKSLAYCVDSVLEAAVEEMEAAAGTGPSVARANEPTESFSRQQLQIFFTRNAERIAAAALAVRTTQPEFAARLNETCTRISDMLPLLDMPGAVDLEDLERRLTVVEEKLSATMMANAPDEFLVNVRREMDRQLAPYRRRMTAAQLSQLEQQYIQKRLWERYNLPRLSLFYLT